MLHLWNTNRMLGKRKHQNDKELLGGGNNDFISLPTPKRFKSTYRFCEITLLPNKGEMMGRKEEKIKRVEAQSRDSHIYTLRHSEREDRENEKDGIIKGVMQECLP